MRHLCELQQEARAFVPRTDADAPPADQLDLGAAITTGVFVPVQPFFEAKAASAAAGEGNDSDEGFEQLAAAEQTAGGGGLATIAPTATAGGSSPVLPVVDANRFLAEQRRSLAEKFCQLTKAFPPPDAAKLVSHAEATLMVVLLHAADVAASWAQGVQYIEEMLRSQLVAAVGKEVGPQDFADYMQFHNQRLYQPEFRPAPFCHAIRAEGHSPEGVLSIEGADGQPVFTASRQLVEVVPHQGHRNPPKTLDQCPRLQVGHQPAGQSPVRPGRRARIWHARPERAQRWPGRWRRPGT